MFRLMALLCAGLYAAMLTLGQDHGQLRFGLMQAKAEKAAADIVATAPEAPVPAEDMPAPIVAAAFVPEKPLMSAPEAVETPAPDAPEEGKLFYIAAANANVREGPGKDHAVIERLPKGEAVLVMSYGEGPEGWSLIRIEGDGLQGYVASRLLTE